MIPFHTSHAKRTLAYLRWLRMNTHWWRYFNATSKNLWKYEHMRELLLSDTRWYRSFPAHFHYDVSLDEFYHFLEQVLNELHIPRAILTEFISYARAIHERHHHLHCTDLSFRLINPTQKALILRI